MSDARSASGSLWRLAAFSAATCAALWFLRRPSSRSKPSEARSDREPPQAGRAAVPVAAPRGISPDASPGDAGHGAPFPVTAVSVEGNGSPTFRPTPFGDDDSSSPRSAGPGPRSRSLRGAAASDPGNTAPAYHRGRRSTVYGVSTNLDETRLYQPTTTPKPEPVRQELAGFARRCHLFSHLDDREIAVVVDALEPFDFVQGQKVFTEGQSSEESRLYIIYSGEVSFIRQRTVIRVLGRGGYFGDREVMFVAAKSTHTCRVDSAKCRCYALGSEAYRHILTRCAIGKFELYEGFLDRVPWLKDLTKVEKLQLADALQPMVYEDSEYLIEFDTIGSWMFLILEGTVRVYGRDKGEVVFICTFGVGDCVGELEFINNHRTVADVRAAGRVKAARLHRDHFELCLGPIVDVLRRSVKAGGGGKYAYYHSVMRAMRGGSDTDAATGAGVDGAAADGGAAMQ